MFYGHLQATDAYAHLLAHPVWRQAFDWLRATTPAVKPGSYELRGRDLYVNVDDCETLPREQCRFESHRSHLDIQYCITGGEVMDCELASRLQPDGPFDAARDLQFYHPAGGLTVLRLLPGDFTIFHPSDAHRPRINDGTHPRTLKAVFKIKLALLTA